MTFIIAPVGRRQLTDVQPELLQIEIDPLCMVDDNVLPLDINEAVLTC